jgi:hypothetical protein
VAKFNTELPLDLIEQFNSLAENGAEKMLNEMVSAGAEVVEKNIRANMRKAFKNPTRLEKCLRITRVYKTIYDDGINRKVAFYGYLEGTEGTVTKKTVTKTYGKLNKKGKIIWQNRKRVGETSTKTYSHNYGVPAPLVAIAREYGTSKGEKKKPFVRPAFKKAQITSAMLKVQEQYIKNE